MKTKIQLFSLTTIISLFILMIGCTPCYYAPNAQNVPVFHEKGQGNGTFSFQTGPHTFGWNVQGALAVSKHIGIMGNYNHYSDKESYVEVDGIEYKCHFKSNMGELGLGYYYPFSDKFVFETYAGFGGSRLNSEYDESIGSGTGSIGTTTIFIQPSIGLYKKNVRLAVSTRVRSLSFRDIKYTGGSSNSSIIELQDLDNLETQWFFEPAFTFRAGGEKVKFQFQVGWSIPMNQTYYFEYDPFNINLGIVFCVPWKKKGEEK